MRPPESNTPPSEDEPTTHEPRPTSARGQIDLQLMFAGFFILLISGPLIAMGVKLQQGFAEMPGVSPLWAAFIAFLFVAAIVLGIFEKAAA